MPWRPTTAYDLSDPYDVSSWYEEKDLETLTDEEKAEVYNDLWSNFCVS